MTKIWLSRSTTNTQTFHWRESNFPHKFAHGSRCSQIITPSDSFGKS